MTTPQARTILDNSFKDLVARGNRLYFELIDQEVIHNACLYILKDKAWARADEYALAFTSAASELVEFYKDKYVDDAMRNIKKNVEWSELWDFLKDYFMERHKMDIDA